MMRKLFSGLGRQWVSGKSRRNGRRRGAKRSLGVVSLGLERMEDRRLLAAGDLDTTFDLDGTVVDNLQVGKNDQINTVAIHHVAGEDKILVAGFQVNASGPATRDVLVARYNADGSRDTTFGTGGVTVIDASTLPGGDNDAIHEILIDDQNRIMLFGGARTTISSTNFFGVLVMRLTESGQLDTSFDGDGKVITVLQNSLGQNINVLQPDTGPRVTAAALQADGKFVVGTTTNVTTGTRRDFAVLRYNADGSLDTSFDSDGYVITNFNGNDDALSSIAVQSDGRIIALGAAELASGGGEDVALVRYNSDGSLDTTFGTLGKVTTKVSLGPQTEQDFPTTVLVEPDGQIVVGGYLVDRSTSVGPIQRDMFIARYDSGGTLDTSFGPSSTVPGTVRVSFIATPNTQSEQSFAMLIQPDGKYVIGGHVGPASNDRGFALARLLPTDGSLDTTFSGDGKVTTSFAGQDFLALNDIVLQSDGKIVAAGFQRPVGGDFDVTLARYESGLLVADAGGPYTLDEPGGSVMLSGSGVGTGTLTLEWDLDGDSIYGETGAGALFGDEVGSNPTFTVTGVDGPTVFNISLRVSSDENMDMIPDQIAFDSTTVTVVNVAPTVAADLASVTVDEGDTANNTGTFGDVGPDVVTLTASIGSVIDTGGGTWSWSFDTTDGPDESQIVTITATDDDGDFSEATFQLVVNNLAPTVAADNAAVSVNEGDTAANTGTYDDVGDDTVTLFASVGMIIDNMDGTWSWSFDSTDGPDESQLVTITATDSDGDSSIATFQLTVNNVAPTVTVDDDPVVVNEGDTAANTGTYSDPGDDTVTLFASVGMIIDNMDGTWSWSLDTTDGPDETQLVTITATDSDGDSSIATFQLAVNNVAPTVTVDDDPVVVNEGDTATNSGTFADVGADVVTLTASVGTVIDTGGGTWNWSFDTTDGPDDSQLVTITATDDDGDFSEMTFQLVVDNVAPTVTVDNAAVTVDEGDTAANSGTFADVAADVVTLTASVGTVIDTGGGTWSWSFDTVDGPDDSQLITITATDDDGEFSQVTFALTVDNVAPTADAGGPYFTFDDTPITLDGTATDPGALDALTFEWDLDGDGIFGETGGAAERGDELGANPVFDPTGLSTGSYDVTLRVSDGDGGVTDATTTVDVLGTGTLLIDGTLYIIGTEECDIVFVKKHNGSIKVYATFNDDIPVVFDADDVDQIDVRVRGGNDIVVFSHTVSHTTTIDGGSGHDILKGGSGRDLILGGSGNDLLAGEAGDDVLMGGTGRDDMFGGSGDDVLVGGDADDLLYGGSGRDLMIGGQDNDWINGGSDDDILIGGITIHDNDVDALDAVMAVWTSSQSFADRVETLTEEGGLLEAGVAVFDDDESDVLIGGSGRDLLFADITFAGGDHDCVLFNHHYDYLEVVN